MLCDSHWEGRTLLAFRAGHLLPESVISRLFFSTLSVTTRRADLTITKCMHVAPNGGSNHDSLLACPGADRSTATTCWRSIDARLDNVQARCGTTRSSGGHRYPRSSLAF